MSIETTHKVHFLTAIEMLRNKNVTVFIDDCFNRLSHLLYENRESEFENYEVVNYTMEEEKCNEKYPHPYWKFGW